MALWKDHLIFYLISYCTFLLLQQSCLITGLMSGEENFTFCNWIKAIYFSQFRPVSQGWNNLKIHPVGIFTVEFGSLTSNKISKYILQVVVEMFHLLFSVMKLQPVYIWDLCFCNLKLPYVRWKKRYAEIKWFICNIMMAFIINSLPDSNVGI